MARTLKRMVFVRDKKTHRSYVLFVCAKNLADLKRNEVILKITQKVRKDLKSLTFKKKSAPFFVNQNHNQDNKKSS